MHERILAATGKPKWKSRFITSEWTSERDTTENTVKIFNWFKPKSNAPKGLVRLEVEFTDDENAAMSRALERFDAVVTNAHAPEGTRMFAPPKVRSAISAQGLTEYVADLQREIENSDLAATTAKLMEKAVKAQMKAYALHNLPNLPISARPNVRVRWQ